MYNKLPPSTWTLPSPVAAPLRSVFSSTTCCRAAFQGKMAQAKARKWLKPRPKSGRDWLMCSTFARRRSYEGHELSCRRVAYKQQPTPAMACTTNTQHPQCNIASSVKPECTWKTPVCILCLRLNPCVTPTYAQNTPKIHPKYTTKPFTLNPEP